jgi:hypothetical protein
MNAPSSRAKAPARARLPAFGRKLLALRRQGLVPACRVVVALDKWKHGRSYARVVVPEDTEPNELDFSFLAGLDVELVWSPYLTTVERRNAAIRAILKPSPERLIMWVLGTETRQVWIKSKAVGIELAEFA